MKEDCHDGSRPSHPRPGQRYPPETVADEPLPNPWEARLGALLIQRPDSARYHYLMANALNNDTKADPQRAADHYRKSLRLDPKQPACLGRASHRD